MPPALTLPKLRLTLCGALRARYIASNSMLRELTATLHPVFAQPQFSTDNAMGVAVLTKRLTEE